MTVWLAMLGMGTILIMAIIGTLQVFDIPYIMTQGGPNFATRSILQLVYDEGFTNFRTGYAAAVSMLLSRIHWKCTSTVWRSCGGSMSRCSSVSSSVR